MGSPNLVDWVRENCHVTNSKKGSTIDLALTPYFIEPFTEIFENPDICEAVVVAPTGMGKTTLMNAITQTLILRKPSEMMLASTDENLIVEFFNMILKPSMMKNEKIKSIWPKRSSDLKKGLHLDHMNIFTGYATSLPTFQSRSCDFVLADEVWDYPQGSLGELRRRLHNRPNARMVALSQASWIGDDFNHAAKNGKTRVFSWPCKCCGEMNPYKFENLLAKYDVGSDKVPIWSSVDVKLKCPHCGHEIDDTPEARRELVEASKYIDEDPNQNHLEGHVTWRMNALANYSVSWKNTYIEFLQADLSPDRKTAVRQFYQKRLAEFWDENKSEDVPVEVEVLGDDYGMGELIDDRWESRFMGVDVQKNRAYIVIRDFDISGNSRLVDAIRVSYLHEIPFIAQRYGVNPNEVCIDAAYRSEEVKILCAKHGYFAINGRKDSAGYPHPDPASKTTINLPYSLPVLSKHRIDGMEKVCRLVYYGGVAIKDTLATLQERGQWRIPSRGDNLDEYMLQINSEVRDVNSKTGRPYYRQVREDNHFFDCEAQIIVMAGIWKRLDFSTGDEVAIKKKRNYTLD